MGEDRSQRHEEDRHGKRRAYEPERSAEAGGDGEESRKNRKGDDEKPRHHISSRQNGRCDESRHRQRNHTSLSPSPPRHHDRERSSRRRRESDSENSETRTRTRHTGDKNGRSGRHDYQRRREHDGDRHRSQHHHHHHDRSRHYHDEDDEERRRRRRERKHAKAHKDGRSGAVTQQFGKYGIIAEVDVTSRLAGEFRQWLVEERQINPETIARARERKQMAMFIEDFNTATFPDIKYYNLEAHERKMAMIRAGEALHDVDEFGGSGYDPLADERAAKATFKAQQRAVNQGVTSGDRSGASEQATWHSKAQLEELRRVQKERIEAVKMRQLGLQTSATMGVRMDGTKFDKR